jgi:uncharacterized protein (TIGR02145 family)
MKKRYLFLFVVLSCSNGGENIQGVLFDDVDNVNSETKNMLPAQVSLSSPQDDATEVVIQPTLEWLSSDQSKFYDLQVSTDGFSSYVVDISTTNTSYSISSDSALEYRTTYSWRVRGSNTTGDGDWSAVRDFTTKIEPLSRVSLSSPSDDASDVVLQPTLSWSSSARSTEYDVQVSTDGFSSYVVDISTTNTSYSLDFDLEYATTYSWRVRGTNNGGKGDWSSVWDFTTEDKVIDKDGNEYQVIKIGEQIWMAENLNIGSKVNGINNQHDNGQIEKYCYDDNTANCNEFGGLYTYSEAMNYTTQDGSRGICMEGWRIPTDNDWQTLEIHLGMSQNDAERSGWRGTDQGQKLKSSEVWNGSNTSGFSSLPAGIYTISQSSYSYMGIDGSTAYISSNIKTVRQLSSNNEIKRTNEYWGWNNSALSVRCILD